MMYTRGIRKIFTSQNTNTLTEALNQARRCGFEFLSFNGDIYFLSRDTKWEKTNLTLDDFEV